MAASMVLAASCVLFTACSSDYGIGTSNRATVRFANAATGGTGSLGLSVDGGAQGSAVAYQNSGSCLHITPGSTDFSVAAAGSSTAVAQLSSQNLTAGTHYTLVASGSATSPTLTLLTNTYTTPASGRARLRLFNAVGLANVFDVYVGAPGAALGTANQTNVGYQTSQSYLDIPAGSSTQVSLTAPGLQTIVGTSATFTPSSGAVTTMVATPATTGGGLYTSFFVPDCP